MKERRASVLLVLLASTLPCAHAQAAASAPDADAQGLEDMYNIFAEQEEIITSATLRKQRLSEAPARVIVISKEDIQKRGYRTLPDVFRDLPGYEATYNASSEWGTHLVVRGVPGNHRLVFLLNGQRINPAGGEQVPLFQNLSMTFVDHIEVMYGPGSALYGNDAFNGVVNVITTTAAQGEHITANAVYGMYNTADVSLLGAKNFGELQLTLGGHFTRRDSPNIYRQYPRDYTYPVGPDPQQGTSLESIAGAGLGQPFSAPELGYDVFARMVFRDFSLQYFHRGYDLSSSWDRGAIAAPYVSEARLGDSQDLVQAEYTLRAGVMSSRTTLGYNSYQLLPNTRFVFPTNLSAGLFNTSDYRVGRSSGLRFEEKIDFDLIKEVLIATIGVVAQDIRTMPAAAIGQRLKPTDDTHTVDERRSYHEYTGPGDLPAVDLTGTVIDPNPSLFGPAKNVAPMSEFQYPTIGLYNQWLWYPAEIFQLTAGLRWDYSPRFGHSVNPRIAMVLAPWRRTVFKLFYGKAYLEPTPYEVSGSFVTNAQVLIPNPGLKPENLHAVEVMWQQDIASSLRTTLNGFVTFIDNTINPETWTRSYVYLDVSPGVMQQRELLQTINGGRGIYYGGEATAQLKVRKFEASGNASLLFGDVNALTVRGDTYKSDPIGSSTFMLKVNLNYEVLPRLFINVSGGFYTSPYLPFSKKVYPFADDAKPYVLLNAHIRYTLPRLFGRDDTFSLFVTGLNLLDQRYKTVSGRPSLNPIGAPQPSLSVTGGIEYRFAL